MGNELEGKIGELGAYAVDVKPDGTVRVELSGQDSSGIKGGAFVELPLVAIMKVAAAKSDNKIDDGLVAIVEAAFHAIA